MLDVVDIMIRPTFNKMGTLKLRYYELVIKCDICLYKDAKLWIRMPEIWTEKEDGIKKRFVYWEGKDTSDAKQDIILKKVFDLTGLDVPKAIELRRKWFDGKKKADKNKENT